MLQLPDFRMRDLGKYHARGIHTWEGSECEFHPALVCSCGKCDNELKCHAKAYESKHVLTCSLRVV